jgi:anti-sigma factor RsiW
MTCADVRSVLQIYIDNEMSALDARPIEEHLRGCQDCRERAEFYHRQDALLREAVLSAPVEADLLRQRIRGRIAANRWSAARAWGLAAAAVVVVTLGSLAALRFGGEPDPFYRAATAEHVRVETGGHPPPPDLSALIASFTNGQPVDLDFPNFRLVGGHPCELGEIGVAHLVYAAPDGRMISVYLCAKPGAMPRGSETMSTPDGPVEIASIDGRTIAAVDAAGIRRVVVGDGFSREEVLATLRHIR